MTVTVQVVVEPTLMEPGLHTMEVVVGCATAGVVTGRLNLPLDVPVWFTSGG